VPVTVEVPCHDRAGPEEAHARRLRRPEVAVTGAEEDLDRAARPYGEIGLAVAVEIRYQQPGRPAVDGDRARRLEAPVSSAEEDVVTDWVALLNNGDGRFGAPTFGTAPPTDLPWALGAADLNGDGRVDIVETTDESSVTAPRLGSGSPSQPGEGSEPSA
jgi:hypothetical protein